MLLPQSFLSTSSLKNEQETKTKGTTSKQYPAKRQRRNDQVYNTLTDVSSGSSSDTDSDEASDNSDTYSQKYLENDISILTTKIQHQQLKQRKYMEKLRVLDKTIRKNTAKLGELTQKLITQQQTHPRHTNSISTHSTSFEAPNIVEEQPLFSPIKSDNRSTDDTPISMKTTLGRRESVIQKTHSDKIVSSTKNKIVSRLKGEDTNRSSSRNNSSDSSNEWAYQNSFDMILRKKETVDKEAFDRKTRQLLFNRVKSNSNQHIEDLMAVSTLNGELQFWDTKYRKKVKALGSDIIFKNTWIEDMCWSSETTLAMIPAVKGEPGTIEQSVVVVDIISSNKDNVEGCIRTLMNKPHEKGLAVIASVGSDFGTNSMQDGSSFVTAGIDKTAYLWKLTRDGPSGDYVETLHPLHIRHTSRIQALYVDKDTDTLFSGSADYRLCGYDLKKEIPTFETKFENRVNHINSNAATPNNLLISLSRKTDQFCLVDKRCVGSKEICLQFGSVEDENLSRYIRPDWHGNGYTVVCGSQADPRLKFWDMRYINVSKGPSFTVEMQGISGISKSSRISQSVFLPNRDTMVTVASTRVLTWMDYIMQPGIKPLI
ncbi:WD40-repeat-containing domain protein [Halteromyces radiatus]|uniref:WD40-repeat-containing domain protein n=1 Tax=Halteromyces radiatus TaxID=101107 RepID=UPI00221EDD14|nr:WD40-repeat-containing domain protein [Halteromyces radiatus]KAI8083049.1 WD40-repeat-containing domain protein [Halteromyces radiatus]